MVATTAVATPMTTSPATVVAWIIVLTRQLIRAYDARTFIVLFMVVMVAVMWWVPPVMYAE